MTPEQIDLIRGSFAKILHQKDEAGTLFYDRLFKIAPEVRPLFKNDMSIQVQKLMDTLAVAVNALRDRPTLVATLEDLGRRHRTYGVQPVHYAKVGVQPVDYAKVGEALIWTLQTQLGPAFDPPTRAAWTQLYAVVSTTMERHLAA